MEEISLEKQKFVLMTMHRPATVDNEEELLKLIGLIDVLTEKYKVFFPIHPRTSKKLEELSMLNRLTGNDQLIMSGPIGYFEFQQLVKNCKFIITDSGGIQEESTYRQVPCITLRPNTERPVTVAKGSNTLISFDINELQKLIGLVESGSYKKGAIPDYWDGKATDRIIENILKEMT